MVENNEEGTHWRPASNPHTLTHACATLHTQANVYTHTSHATKHKLMKQDKVGVKAQLIKHMNNFIPHLLLYYKYVQVQ